MRYQKASTCSRNQRTEYCNTVTSWAPLIIILFNIQFKLQILHQIDPANTPIYSGGQWCSSYSTLTNSITLKPHLKGLFMFYVGCQLQYVTHCTLFTNLIDFNSHLLKHKHSCYWRGIIKYFRFSLMDCENIVVQKVKLVKGSMK